MTDHRKTTSDPRRSAAHEASEDGPRVLGRVVREAPEEGAYVQGRVVRDGPGARAVRARSYSASTARRIRSSPSSSTSSGAA